MYAHCTHIMKMIKEIYESENDDVNHQHNISLMFLHLNTDIIQHL